MDALTLLLIVDMCNPEHEASDHGDRPAITQPYTAMYPHLVSPALRDKENDCNAYRKPPWLTI